MKLIILTFIFFALSLPSSAQNNRWHVIQVNGHVDILGNITMLPLEKTPKADKKNSDTTINHELLNKIVASNPVAIKVINRFMNEGWNLITSVYISKDENGRPNSPYIAYYFKKSF